MGFNPEQPEEGGLNIRKALSELKNDVMKTVSPYMPDFINNYVEKYSKALPDLGKEIGITPEQEADAQKKAAEESPDTSAPTTTPAPVPALAPSPSPAPQTTPAAVETAPAVNNSTPAITESAPIPLETLRQEYRRIDQLRQSTAITAQTRDRVNKELDLMLRMAPNYLKMQMAAAPDHQLEEVEQLGMKMENFSPLVDLSAFDLDKLRAGTLNLDALKQRGIRELVLMEDRDPQFFLNYRGFNGGQTVPLNRHGSKQEVWTQADLKLLTQKIHQSGMKVTIGFWGNIENAANNEFLKRNWNQVHPVIPGSTDMNPLALIKDENNREMPFADYIVNQYKKLNRDFQFDGLFLGDGLMGYRDFKDPNAPYDFSSTAPLWTDFYKRIHQGVHSVTPDSKLWAYDVMGKGTADARKNGVDLGALTPHLDSFIFQAYGSDAWGKDYMALPGYDLARDQKAISELPPELQAKTKYSVAFGDAVEGWHASAASNLAKHQALKSHAQQGGLGVWSNQVIRRLT